jgi:uncharacterized SAM-binding protein YcdF (DUF218 family)
MAAQPGPETPPPKPSGAILSWRTRILEGIVLGTLSGMGIWQLGLPALRGHVVVVGSVLGMLAAFAHLRRLLWFVGGLVAMCLLVISYTPVVGMLARHLDRRRDELRSCPAVVTLGSFAFKDGTINCELQDRLLRSYAIVHEGYAPELVLTRPSGAATAWDGAAEQQMKQLGIVCPIDVVGPVRDTHDESFKVAELAKSRGWSTVILVTHPWHMRRAAAAFEKAGVHVVCAPCAESRYDWTTLDGPGDRLGCFRIWLHEEVGYWFYRARGWL